MEFIPGLLHQAVKTKEKAQHVLNSTYFISKFFETGHYSGETSSSTEVGEGSSPLLKPIRMTLQRFLDDDKLTDECWNSEMREVELWENERYGGSMQSLYSESYPSASASMQKGWGKHNLRVGERGAWTRSRDGSNVATGGGIGHEGSGEVRFVSLHDSDSLLLFFLLKTDEC